MKRRHENTWFWSFSIDIPMFLLQNFPRLHDPTTWVYWITISYRSKKPKPVMLGLIDSRPFRQQGKLAAVHTLVSGSSAIPTGTRDPGHRDLRPGVRDTPSPTNLHFQRTNRCLPLAATTVRRLTAWKNAPLIPAFYAPFLISHRRDKCASGFFTPEHFPLVTSLTVVVAFHLLSHAPLRPTHTHAVSRGQTEGLDCHVMFILIIEEIISLILLWVFFFNEWF